MRDVHKQKKKSPFGRIENCTGCFKSVRFSLPASFAVRTICPQIMPCQIVLSRQTIQRINELRACGEFSLGRCFFIPRNQVNRYPCGGSPGIEQVSEFIGVRPSRRKDQDQEIRNEERNDKCFFISIPSHLQQGGQDDNFVVAVTVKTSDQRHQQHDRKLIPPRPDSPHGDPIVEAPCTSGQEGKKGGILPAGNQCQNPAQIRIDVSP